jgi:hypothetical protein
MKPNADNRRAFRAKKTAREIGAEEAVFLLAPDGGPARQPSMP